MYIHISYLKHIYIYIYIQKFYYQFVLTINISGRRMWTTRFTYFDSKCMHLSKLLHNLWSTFFVLIYLLSGRTDNRKTDILYIYMGHAILTQISDSNLWLQYRNRGNGEKCHLFQLSWWECHYFNKLSLKGTNYGELPKLPLLYTFSFLL